MHVSLLCREGNPKKAAGLAELRQRMEFREAGVAGMGSTACGRGRSWQREDPEACVGSLSLAVCQPVAGKA